MHHIKKVYSIYISSGYIKWRKDVQDRFKDMCVRKYEVWIKRVNINRRRY
jgi:hypothetical protein